jgi:para-nitrobenzyl esterase
MMEATMMRTRFGRKVLVSMLASAVLATGAVVQARAQVMESPVPGDPVAITGGRVAGQRLASGVKAYIGIPFAEPPIMERRWKEPQPVQPWRGVRYALNYAPMCPQGMRGPGQNHYFGAEPTTEDCLYLNLWAPQSARAGAKLPVVVWIYGGGFSGGSTSMMWARGETLAGKGVIYVGANYRVGALGFLAHPELSRESPHGASGNYGFLDQVAALQWVQANIAAFGGDPDNVTVMGQSAGSMAISSLHASPLAKGLFKRAIGMSGSMLSTETAAPQSKAESEAVGLALQSALNAKSLAELRLLPADRIIQARARTGPNVDGWFLPRSTLEIFRAGQHNDVGLFVGFTRDEAFSGLAGATSAEDYADRVRAAYPAEAERLLTLYPATGDWKRTATDLARDASLGVMTRRWAQGQAGPDRQPAYAFLFSRVHPYTPGLSFIDHNPQTAGAYHAGDIVYWTGNLDGFNAYRTSRDWTGLDRSLSDTMSDMVVAFARTGDPSIPGQAVPRYDPRNERMVEVGDMVRAIDFPGRDAAGLLDGLVAAPPRAPSAPAAPAATGLGGNAGPRF